MWGRGWGGGEGGVAVVVFVGFCLHKVELLSFKTDETLSYWPWESTVEPH